MSVKYKLCKKAGFGTMAELEEFLQELLDLSGNKSIAGQVGESF